MSGYGFLSEILFRLAKPFLNKKYDEGNDQRFGRYSDELPKDALWVHAVSVGEVQSAYPFVKRYKTLFPERQVLLSTITKTGKAMSGQLMGDMINQIYYPWDAPSILDRALTTLQPRAYVTIETEIWPEMLYQLEKRNIPAFLVNGRLSQSSFLKYERFHRFWSSVINRYSLLMVRSQADRERFEALGAHPDKIKVTGDCKVDALIERKENAELSALKALLPASAPVILAGSTHEGEEMIVFKAYAALLNKYRSLRLVVVPRHPERAQVLLREAEKYGLGKTVLMSRPETEWNVMIVDKIGVLFSLYGCVNAAFLGGSIAPKGGQNIMEPAIWGIPFCQGPDYRDFTEATDGLVKAGVCQIVHDDKEMCRFFDGVLKDGDIEKYHSGSRTFFESLGGASRKSCELIESILDGR